MDQDHSTAPSRESGAPGLPIQLKLMLGVLSLAIIALIARIFGFF